MAIGDNSIIEVGVSICRDYLMNKVDQSVGANIDEDDDINTSRHSLTVVKSS